jgi:methionyl-tRNA formyltransferase
MSQKEPLFAFFGTPRFAAKVLDALEACGLLPALIVTAPDKKQGRGMQHSPSPVKQWALERGIDVMTPEKLSQKEFVAELKNSEWDVFVVAAYAKLLPNALLEIPRRGCLNIHPSLLPKFRGPSPILSAILADERTTGVSLMLMSERMDAGPLIAQARIELEESAWPPKASLLEDLLAREGGKLLAEVLPEWLAGAITPEPQNEREATYTKKFTDEDARLDISNHALDKENFLKIRAFDKNPRVYFIERGKRVIITEAELNNGKLQIMKVIPEGKKEMPFTAYRAGRANTP